MENMFCVMVMVIVILFEIGIHSFMIGIISPCDAVDFV